MTSIRNILATAKSLNEEIAQQLAPPEEGFSSRTDIVILKSLVRGTRGYIERVANQINGAYESGWYDACAVMLRRLIETLLIETFEHHGIAEKIKNSNNDFLFLKDLIAVTLSEPSWNLTRNVKQSLPRLKDIGDKSAHSRRYLAQRGDIAPLLPDIRAVVQEFLFLSGLK